MCPYCSEKVGLDIRKSPWQAQGILWAHLLDALRCSSCRLCVPACVVRVLCRSCRALCACCAVHAVCCARVVSSMACAVRVLCRPCRVLCACCVVHAVCCARVVQSMACVVLAWSCCFILSVRLPPNIDRYLLSPLPPFFASFAVQLKTWWSSTRLFCSESTLCTGCSPFHRRRFWWRAPRRGKSRR